MSALETAWATGRVPHSHQFDGEQGRNDEANGSYAKLRQRSAAATVKGKGGAAAMPTVCAAADVFEAGPKMDVMPRANLKGSKIITTRTGTIQAR